jgi:glycosidase
MQWSAEPGGGFTTAGATPWLPFGDLEAHNVAAQREDPGSVLHLVRDLIALRRERLDLRDGAYESLPAPDGAWAWRRGEGTAVAVNLSRGEVEVDGLEGTVLVATDRVRDGEAVAGPLRLAPGEGAVVGRA